MLNNNSLMFKGVAPKAFVIGNIPQMAQGIPAAIGLFYWFLHVKR